MKVLSCFILLVASSFLSNGLAKPTSKPALKPVTYRLEMTGGRYVKPISKPNPKPKVLKDRTPLSKGKKIPKGKMGKGRGGDGAEKTEGAKKAPFVIKPIAKPLPKKSKPVSKPIAPVKASTSAPTPGATGGTSAPTATVTGTTSAPTATSTGTTPAPTATVTGTTSAPTATGTTSAPTVFTTFQPTAGSPMGSLCFNISSSLGCNLPSLNTTCDAFDPASLTTTTCGNITVQLSYNITNFAACTVSATISTAAGTTTTHTYKTGETTTTTETFDDDFCGGVSTTYTVSVNGTGTCESDCGSADSSYYLNTAPIS